MSKLSPSKQERRGIQFPMWRKKVDSSILTEGETHLPKSVCSTSKISTKYKGVSAKDKKSMITIKFKKNKYLGWIFEQKTPKYQKFKLRFEQRLANVLKDEFCMTYMRDVENRISEVDNKRTYIEDEIPFWEFLDIEFNIKKKEVLFFNHYYQKPLFPNLFKKIIQSTVIRQIDDSLKNKTTIYKEDWKPVSEFKKEIGASNIIYMLLNETKKKLYIGETGKNINDRYKNLNEWEYYRYDKLPDELGPHRVSIERMLIRMFSSIMDSKNNIDTKSISYYKLKNNKIDK